jgi:hypothetical protein
MCCRVFRSVAVACLLLAVLAGAVWYELGATAAQEAIPTPSHGQGWHDSSEASVLSPYVDDVDPDAPIRSLTPEEVAQIERGEGAGFALPAELNGVPGPRHVLDLAHELGLSHQQLTEVRAVSDEMRAAVVPAGRRYLDALQALEENFRAGTLTEAELPGRVAETKRLEGELAAAHLVAHLKTAALLRPEQIAAYNRLRGYQ